MPVTTPATSMPGTRTASASMGRQVARQVAAVIGDGAAVGGREDSMGGEQLWILTGLGLLHAQDGARRPGG